METSAPASPATGCPDRGLLINFDLGKLSVDDLDAVALHVASCPPCEQFLHTLHGREDEDSVVGRLKQSLGRAPFPVWANGAPTVTASGTVPIDAFASTLEAWSTEGHRKALEATHRYELLEKIGQGGMGVVYRARQLALKREVALKMILAGPDASVQTVARFLREGKVVARLRHPNIVQVYELDQSEGLPYFSMELVEGKDLKQRLTEGPFGLREAAELVRTLAAAVEYAHREGILHRDLKPANILLAGDGTPRITDFGLAKWLDSDSGDHTSAALTETESILGSPSYMAPEQAEGRSADTGKATDVYALGVILYELLTGRPPFVGATKLHTMDLVRTAEPVPPSRQRPGVPSWLEAICLRCLEKSPDRRYPTAQALADDLGAWLRDERPRGIPNGLTKIGRGMRRHAAALLIGSALFAAGTAAYLFAYAPERAIQRAEDELARGRAVTLVGATGMPRWSRWPNGQTKSLSVLADDGTLSVQSWVAGLLELMPDPRTDSYQFSAQIRHEASLDKSGQVGLYVARKAYPGGRSDIQCFTGIGFNDILNVEDHRAQIYRFVGKGEPPGPPLKNAVRIFARLLSNEAILPIVDRVTGVAGGPRFKAMGDKKGRKGRWHDLVVTVTPTSVTGRWNGEPFSAFTSLIQQRIDTDLIPSAPRQGDPMPPGLRPKFHPRGGLGIYVQRGAASFRAITVTPLHDQPRPLTTSP